VKNVFILSAGIRRQPIASSPGPDEIAGIDNRDRSGSFDGIACRLDDLEA
jgi:hypothetical protein